MIRFRRSERSPTSRRTRTRCRGATSSLGRSSGSTTSEAHAGRLSALSAAAPGRQGHFVSRCCGGRRWGGVAPPAQSSITSGGVVGVCSTCKRHNSRMRAGGRRKARSSVERRSGRVRVCPAGAACLPPAPRRPPRDSSRASAAPAAAAGARKPTRVIVEPAEAQRHIWEASNAS